jgi:hypothetical protein
MYALEFEIPKNLPVLCVALRVIMFDLTMRTNRTRKLKKVVKC